MKKGMLLVSLLVLVFVLSSMGFAVSNHTVNVVVSPFVAIRGDATINFGTIDLFNTTSNNVESKTATGTGNFEVRSNSSAAHHDYANASDFTSTPVGSTISIGKLQAAISGTGGYTKVLGAANAVIYDFNKTSGWDSKTVSYTLTLDGSEDAGTYSTTVVYTVVPQ